jgi:DNA mismatch endonuclease (patch repair protein)
MDVYSPAKRSYLMSRVRGRNTRAEVDVRRLLHGMGYRFRLHCAELPGRPDIVLPRFRTVVFVHGCFWHRHRSCKKATTPSTNQRFWHDKFEANVKRDRRNQHRLRRMGWKVIVVWECEVRDEERLKAKLERRLEG